MADIRKLIASAITGHNLEASDIDETSLDRIIAFGGSAIRDQGFGCALWRLKYANDPSQFFPALDMLQRRMGASEKKSRVLAAICERVLREWVYEVCEDCYGRGKLVVEGTPHILHDCIPCEGTGIRRPSEAERVAKVGISHAAYQKWQGKFASVRNLLEATDQQSIEDVNKLLGRYGRKIDLNKYLPKGIDQRAA